MTNDQVFAELGEPQSAAERVLFHTIRALFDQREIALRDIKEKRELRSDWKQECDYREACDRRDYTDQSILCYLTAIKVYRTNC